MPKPKATVIQLVATSLVVVSMPFMVVLGGRTIAKFDNYLEHHKILSIDKKTG